MTFQKKYTDEMILKIIDENDNIVSSKQVMEGLGCVKLTANNLLKSMAASKKITAKNVGTINKPVWIYSRTLTDK